MHNFTFIDVSHDIYWDKTKPTKTATTRTETLPWWKGVYPIYDVDETLIGYQKINADGSTRIYIKKVILENGSEIWREK